MSEQQGSKTDDAAQGTVRAAGRGRHDIRENRQAIVFGTLAGWFMRLCSATLRFEIEDRCGIGKPGTHPAPVIYALWHNRFFTVPFAWRKTCGTLRRSVVLTSASYDGAMVARAMAVFGLGAVRGSSSRRAVAALVGMKRAIREGFDVCVTPDGPRGPRYVFHPGLVKLAEATHTPIIPIHVRFSAAWRLRTWDRFVIPKPFSRVQVIFDHPLSVSPAADEAGFAAERLRIENALRAGVDDLDA
ncbi:MAG: lysophospholipid acyltransferase family protein [Verrucomicrobia bacterium]|nr:lysophospholipid acyltransferase family protein [Verrucomicrobiota bacterium]